MRRPDLSAESRFPYFHVARHAVGATTLLVGSVAGLTGAAAQTPAPDQAAEHDSDDQEIVVVGARSVVNEKLGGSVQDAPQSINVISAKTLQEEAVTNLQDALKNVPGITLNAGEGIARGDTVNLRGFPAFNDFFLDGIRDAGLYTRDSFDLEALEVLKGPSAILFGRGSTGGVINQVTKAATLAPVQAGTLQFGTNSEIRLTGDLDMPIGPTAAIRLNAMVQRSDVADRDDVLNRRWGVAPSIALGIGEADTVTLSYLHQQQHDRPDAGIPFLSGAPAPVPRDADFGLISNYFKSDVDIATLRYKHEFSDDYAIVNTARVGNYNFQNEKVSPVYGDDFTTFPGQSPVGILVGRDDPASSGTQLNLTDQLDFKAHSDFGYVTQDLTIGIEIGRETNDLTLYENPFDTDNTWVPKTPLLNPNPHESLPRVEPVAARNYTAGRVQAAYLIDTLHIGPYVDLTGGARFDRFAATFTGNTLIGSDDGPAGSANFGRTDNVTSPRAALVVKPTQDMSFYFSYGTSFDPSAEALSLDSGSANIAPVKAETYEVGAKTVWLDGLLTATAALFRTEVTNAKISDPERPGIIIDQGNQQVDGIELNVSGRITPDWEILAGYIYLDPKTLGGADANANGKMIVNAARNAFNIWTEYYLDDHWEVGTGGNFLGKRYADLDNTASVPSYFVWNGMVAYKVNDHYSLQMNVTNLTDKLYFDGTYYADETENHAIPGAGRTFTFTAKANF
jgi:catecholate siderophore receptor